MPWIPAPGTPAPGTLDPPAPDYPKFRAFFSFSDFLFFQFPSSFVELRWALRVFIIENTPTYPNPPWWNTGGEHELAARVFLSVV